MTTSATAQFELRPGTQIVEFDPTTLEKVYRVELTDGRHFQINERLYWLLNCLQAPLTLANLAISFQQCTGQAVSIEQLQMLSTDLEKQGVLVQPGQASPETRTNDKQTGLYLGLHYRRDLFPPETLAPIINNLQIFFKRTIALVLLLLVVGAHIVAYTYLGFPPDLDMRAISWPLLYGILLISVVIHELGHLAACRYCGCSPGALGVGLYFFSPVLYADVTSAWRLTRWQRALVDVSGIYLQSLCIPILWWLFYETKNTTFLMAIFAIDMMILSNFEPFMKLDGYWLLSDLTGVPNLHVRTEEMVKRGWAWLRWRLGFATKLSSGSPFSQWSPMIQRIILCYVVLSVAIWPVLLIAMIPLVIQAVATYPSLWVTAVAALSESVHTRDLSGILQQFDLLFLPTLTLLNLGFLVKIAFDRLRKNKASSPA